MEFKEHDIVYSKARVLHINTKDNAVIEKGSQGTIVHLYPGASFCEVEFVIDGKFIVTRMPLHALSEHPLPSLN